MRLTVAIQMDPIEGIKIDADSTFALALEAQRRGHALYHYLAQDMTFSAGSGLRPRPAADRAAGSAATTSAWARRRCSIWARSTWC